MDHEPPAMNEQVHVLQKSVPLIEVRIGRGLQTEEKRAIGFVLDRTSQARDEHIFVSGILGIGENPQESKWAIRQKVRVVTETEINRRTGDAVDRGDTQEIDKLRAIRESFAAFDRQIEGRYRRGEDFSLGAIPEYFLPEWVKTCSL